MPARRACAQSALIAMTFGIFWLMSRSRMRVPAAGVMSSIPRCA